MNKKVFVGIDVSKMTFDAVIYRVGARSAADCEHRTFRNDQTGFNELYGWMTVGQGRRAGSVAAGLENTGIYSYELRLFLEGKKIDHSVYNTLALSREMGIVRGKDDRVDAFRIALHTYLHRDMPRYARLSGGTVQRLRDLCSERARLVRQRAANKAFAADRRGRGQSAAAVARAERLVSALDAAVAEVEQEMRQAVEADSSVSANYALLTSIPGVGMANALAVIVSTDNFNAFTDPRKYACHAGIAPFARTSGTSVRGRTGVSRFANRQLKALLTQAARSAVVHDREMRAYAERKCSEGKHYGTVLNAVKFKLVGRMFAVVRRQSPYEPGRAAGAIPMKNTAGTPSGRGAQPLGADGAARPLAHSIRRGNMAI